MLSIDRLSKTYPDGTRALANVSLDIANGEISMLLGTSGCGKTSLLRIIAGLEAQSAGSLTLDGERLHGPQPSIGLVFQEPRLLPWLTAEENVGFGLHALSKTLRAHDVASILERVGLYPQRHKLSRELSGGQQQRVALARALVTRPKVLLLDEPFSALDAMTRERLQDDLLALWEASHITVVMVTHDIEEALYLGHRIFVLRPNPGTLAGIVDVPPGVSGSREGDVVPHMKRRLRDFLEGGTGASGPLLTSPGATTSKRRDPSLEAHL